MNINEFHALEIGDRFMLIEMSSNKFLKTFRGPFIKTNHFSFTCVNECGDSIGKQFDASWHDAIRPLNLDQSIEESNKNVLSTVLI